MTPSQVESATFMKLEENSFVLLLPVGTRPGAATVCPIRRLRTQLSPSRPCLLWPSDSEGAAKVSLLKKVPALKDGDFTLAECTAILLYLSRKYKTPDHWYPSDIRKRAQVDEYLSWHHANIRASAPKTMWIKVLIPLFTGQPLPAEKLQEVMEGLSASLKQFEERFLQDKAFIIGSEISLADLVAIVELMQPVGVGCDVFEDRPRLMEWRRRVEEAVGKELFFQAHEMILNIKELSNIQIDPQLKEHLAPMLMKMLK
ncbi:glutathione S-transferase theta-4 isoform X2 [Dromaius novaehollandiae]|uniref:glutathione transferase n=1 Tax=Dromaius novaehollandiae TaxID=8790 RepID=A0A8C4JPA3_DRONO|nr:glutathione S-transferase theta-1-like [Dromaius novaehollandiae]